MRANHERTLCVLQRAKQTAEHDLRIAKGEYACLYALSKGYRAEYDEGTVAIVAGPGRPAEPVTTVATAALLLALEAAGLDAETALEAIALAEADGVRREPGKPTLRIKAA